MDAMGLGWVVMMPKGNRPLILQKAGGLQGIFSYVAFAPTRGVGVRRHQSIQCRRRHHDDGVRERLDRAARPALSQPDASGLYYIGKEVIEPIWEQLKNR